MKDIKIIHISSNEPVAEECACCFEEKEQFKDFGCQHKVCVDCYKVMKNRKTCLYCDPLPSNHVTINISPRVSPLENITISTTESKLYRLYFLDIFCFVFSSIFCCLFGFVVCSLSIYLKSDSKENASEIYNFDNFSFGKAMLGITYFIILIYILMSVAMIICGTNPLNQDELRVCTLIECIVNSLSKGYDKFKKIICCTN